MDSWISWLQRFDMPLARRYLLLALQGMPPSALRRQLETVLSGIERARGIVAQYRQLRAVFDSLPEDLQRALLAQCIPTTLEDVAPNRYATLRDYLDTLR